MNKNYVFIVIMSIILGSIVGATSALFVINSESKGKLIKDFYLTENAVHVSPHSLRSRMDNNDDSFVLIDLRSKEEYKEAHIIGAINIPAYSDRYTSAYGDIDRIVSEFASLHTDKDIIVYCYSMPCMTGRKVGQMLTEHGIYVKHLGIGWNEWRYFWDLWNHEHEWNTTTVYEYIASGPEPGVPIKRNATGCSLGEFGC
jgi:rhodanese-related sulfurtransferase